VVFKKGRGNLASFVAASGLLQLPDGMWRRATPERCCNFMDGTDRTERSSLPGRPNPAPAAAAVGEAGRARDSTDQSLEAGQ
jgi:hypothetical protein